MWKNIHKYYTPWLDVLTFVIMIGMFSFVVFSYGSIPTEIPIQFNVAGEAIGWENKSLLYGLIVINFNVIVLCFILNYFLIIRSDEKVNGFYLINMPFIKGKKLSTEKIHLVKKNSARMFAVLNLMLSILFGMIYYNLIQCGLGNQGTLGSAIGVIIVLILIIMFYFVRKIYQDMK